MSEQLDEVIEYAAMFLCQVAHDWNPCVKEYGSVSELGKKIWRSLARELLSDPRIGVIDQYQQLETTSITCVSVNEAIQETFDAMIKQGFRRILEK